MNPAGISSERVPLRRSNGARFAMQVHAIPPGAQAVRPGAASVTSFEVTRRENCFGRGRQFRIAAASRTSDTATPIHGHSNH